MLEFNLSPPVKARSFMHVYLCIQERYLPVGLLPCGRAHDSARDAVVSAVAALRTPTAAARLNTLLLFGPPGLRASMSTRASQCVWVCICVCVCVCVYTRTAPLIRDNVKFTVRFPVCCLRRFSQTAMLAVNLPLTCASGVALTPLPHSRVWENDLDCNVMCVAVVFTRRDGENSSGHARRHTEHGGLRQGERLSLFRVHSVYHL